MNKLVKLTKLGRELFNLYKCVGVDKRMPYSSFIIMETKHAIMHEVLFVGARTNVQALHPTDESSAIFEIHKINN